MSKNKKYQNIDPENLMRYSADGLSDEERHALERESQKDPFLEEALEGYSSLNPDQAREDLSRLQSRLNRRTSGKRTMVWVRIAASFAVILTIGTLYFTVFSDKLGRMDRRVAETESAEPAGEKAVPEDFKAIDEIERKEAEIPEKSDNGGEEEAEAVAEIAETGAGLGETVIEDILAEEEEMDEAIADIQAEPLVIEETLIAEDDSQPTDSFQIVQFEEPEKQAEEEVIEELEATSRARQAALARPTAMEGAAEERTADLSASKSMAKKDVGEEEILSSVYEVPDSASAMPVGGLENLNLYIRENASFTEGSAPVTTATVILTFEINSEGRPQNIKIEESTSEEIGRELVRLVQEGPAWLPLNEIGSSIAKRNRLKIEFNRQ